ncbi:hypothetical protein GGP41_006486 [Bipolaris sorokiniana]|uniref:histone deacetylase n=1 Tax=Cochliobolus sativus TaxID=45130 RepID=A0A8H5ZSX3_COCSA|nr:hypothetical protein GGP41_006486 [Bipolaris sorokiniana]
MQQCGQSDNSAEDDSVVSSTDSEDGDDDTYNNNYDDNSDQDSDYIPEKDTPSYSSSAFTTNPAEQTPHTLLNGPQWQLANPEARRAAKVDYRLKKPGKPKTTSTAKKQERKSNDDCNRWIWESAPKPRIIAEFDHTVLGSASQPLSNMRTPGYIPSNGPANNIVQEYLSPDDAYPASFQDFKAMTDAEKIEVIAREAEEHGLERPKGWNVSFHYNPHVEYHHFGSSHPMKPWRLTLTKQLVLAYGLEYTMDLFEPRPANFNELAIFHDREYLSYLSKITPQNAQPDDPQYITYGFGGESNDCPVFDGLWNYVSLYTGATCSATWNLLNSRSDIAINWSGGLHHAKKNLASGFCYVNDIVIAIQLLLSHHQRVLYIDIDVHHGDGVEQAFESTDRVFTLSYHKYGIDKHDRLGRFNLNIKAHGFCVETVKAYGRPLLIIGGGGYTPRNVARTWCHETSVCVGAQLHNELPAHVPYLQAFQGAENGDGVLYPDLHNIKRHENLNSQAKLHKLIEQALENLRYLEGAPSVTVDTRGISLEEIMKVREMIDQELEDEAEDRARLTVENSRRKKERNVGGRNERR